MRESFQLPSIDQQAQLQGYLWGCENPKAVLQLSHGMAEHILRYETFAEYLNQYQIVVVGHDHLGHGGSINHDLYGHFHDKSIENGLVTDLHQVTQYAKKRFANLPYFCLGHSMGSFVLRNYLYEYANELDGAIIVGTGQQPKWLTKAGRALAKNLAKFQGETHHSQLIDRVAFSGNNRRISPHRTEKDWLVSLPDEVDKYLADQLCGFLFTLSGYQELFSLIIGSQDQERIRQLPANIPLLFLSGKEDPIGDYGKGVLKAAKSYQAAGLERIEVHLYENARHEVLNERQKEQVYLDLVTWLKKI
ncbi:alpha/beta fold hydrolase [Enterococcus sp. AZ072]|uniref:alpha/beta fold hydrolase n=1 Tax=unclassified Enterococcus TaxID=2608891 RepID=UPI003D26C061